MITLFLLSMPIARSGFFSSSPSHKEQGRQGIIDKLKDDINEALEKRRGFDQTYRKKNPQYEQQKPVLQALLNRAEKLLEELREDSGDYLLNVTRKISTIVH